MTKHVFYSFCIFMIFLPAASYPQDKISGFSGTIYFRDGNSVDFNYLGRQNIIAKTLVRGQIGTRYVEFPFEELKEIYFSNKNARYDGSPGSDLMVINQEGERLTLTNCIVWGGFNISGHIAYVYNEPGTEALKLTIVSINQNISRIIIGDDTGDMKLNPKTGEYFPAIFIYDPFTGDKLIWVRRK